MKCSSSVISGILEVIVVLLSDALSWFKPVLLSSCARLLVVRRLMSVGRSISEVIGVSLVGKEIRLD